MESDENALILLTIVEHIQWQIQLNHAIIITMQSLVPMNLKTRIKTAKFRKASVPRDVIKYFNLSFFFR